MTRRSWYNALSLAAGALLIAAGGVAACGTDDPETAAAPTHYTDPIAGLGEGPTDWVTTTAPTTTTTTAAPRKARTTPTTARASRSAPPRPAEATPTGDVRRVSSTAYCLTSRTADGGRGYVGSVAMNGVPFGSRWRVQETGAVYVVNDRIGHGSGFDIWKPSCEAAIQYGRRSLTVERVG